MGREGMGQQDGTEHDGMLQYGMGWDKSREQSKYMVIVCCIFTVWLKGRAGPMITESVPLFTTII